jgi:hypothetical protein
MFDFIEVGEVFKVRGGHTSDLEKVAVRQGPHRWKALCDLHVVATGDTFRKNGITSFFHLRVVREAIPNREVRAGYFEVRRDLLPVIPAICPQVHIWGGGYPYPLYEGEILLGCFSTSGSRGWVLTQPQVAALEKAAKEHEAARAASWERALASAPPLKRWLMEQGLSPRSIISTRAEGWEIEYKIYRDWRGPDGWEIKSISLENTAENEVLSEILRISEGKTYTKGAPYDWAGWTITAEDEYTSSSAGSSGLSPAFLAGREALSRAERTGRNPVGDLIWGLRREERQAANFAALWLHDQRAASAAFRRFAGFEAESLEEACAAIAARQPRMAGDLRLSLYEAVVEATGIDGR